MFWCKQILAPPPNTKQYPRSATDLVGSFLLKFNIVVIHTWKAHRIKHVGIGLPSNVLLLNIVIFWELAFLL